ELRGEAITALIRFGSTVPGGGSVCLGDYANSRGAADMGLYPGLLPGYLPVTKASKFEEEWASVLPREPGMNLHEMFEAAAQEQLSALYVVGANPIARYNI